LLAALKEKGAEVNGLRVLISDFGGESHNEILISQVMAPLAARFPQASLALDNTRQAGRDYYYGICFYIHAQDRNGKELNLADGGFTDWTQQLISRRSLRLLISGMGTERACSL
jgi:hypothetical protein